MTYPVMVFVMAILAVIGMLLFIVPIFDKMFTDLGGKRRWPTQILRNPVGDDEVAARRLPGDRHVAFASGGGGTRTTRRSGPRCSDDTGRSRSSAALFQKVAIARFTRNFGTMLGAASRSSRRWTSSARRAANWVIERAVKDVQESVRTGQSLSDPLATSRSFPPMGRPRSRPGGRGGAG